MPGDGDTIDGKEERSFKHKTDEEKQQENTSELTNKQMSCILL